MIKFSLFNAPVSHLKFAIAALTFGSLLFGCGSSPSATTDLSSANGYVILAKTGISNATGSTIYGNLGVSPAAATYITGFGLTADSSNTFSTSASVVGKIYAADYAAPTPTVLTSAIGNMQTTYTELAGRAPIDTELHTGILGSQTIPPGVHYWSTSVGSAGGNLTLNGSSTDVWVFQVAQNVTIAAAYSVVLTGGALARNVYWQVAGQVTTGSTSHFEGNIYSQTAITLGNLASLTGRAFAQTRVNLDNNAITQP